MGDGPQRKKEKLWWLPKEEVEASKMHKWKID